MRGYLVYSIFMHALEEELHSLILFPICPLHSLSVFLFYLFPSPFLSSFQILVGTVSLVSRGLPSFSGCIGSPFILSVPHSCTCVVSAAFIFFNRLSVGWLLLIFSFFFLAISRISMVVTSFFLSLPVYFVLILVFSFLSLGGSDLGANVLHVDCDELLKSFSWNR